MHDVVIIGGGISAHTAALYTARANLKPLVLTGPDLDQLSLTTTVENYPGFPDGVQGPDLVDNAKKQAQKFGAEYKTGLVESVTKKDNHYVLTVKDTTYEARTVIICTGASARLLKIPGEQEYFGKGVSTCAVCDAALYHDKIAVVVGGGDSAMEESLALYKFAKKVIIIHRKDTFRASKIMQERIKKLTDKIEIIWDTTVTEVTGDGKFVTGVKTKNLKTNKEETIACDGMFLAIGHIPNTGFLNNVTLDEHKYIITDKKSHTNLEGVYAAGDCQDSVFKQAVTSAGTGCQAAIEAERYIEHLQASGEYK